MRMDEQLSCSLAGYAGLKSLRISERVWMNVISCQNEGAKRMKKSLVTMLLVLATAALVQQSAAQGAAQPAQAGQPAQPTQKKEIKDPAEYNSYVNAIQQTNPQLKSQAAGSVSADLSQ